MSDKKKLFLILDGNALLHRAWHALPPLTTKDGLVVNAAYGFAMVLEKMLETRQPDYMAVAWDLPGETFRHEKYADYKGTREKKEQELYDQIPMIQEILEAFDIPSYEAKGFEADDIIGTLAYKMDKKPEINVEIVTGDLDALQLVTDGTKVLFFQKGISETKLYDIEAVKERYGLTPDELIDYKALKGDASDNIPGVAGVGDKTATELIQKFGSLKQMYKDLKSGKTKDLKPKIVEKLLENEKVAFDSQELVTIVLDVPVKFKLSDVKLGQKDEEKIVKLYKDYEFKSLLRKRGQVEDQPKKATKTTKAQKASNDLETLRGAKELAFFAGENQQTDLFGSGLATLALSDSKKTVIISNPSVEQISVALDILSQAKQIICHDVKRLLHLLPFTQYDLPFYDLMIASYLLNAGSRSHTLEDVAQESVGAELRLPEDVSRFFEIYKKQISELKDDDMIKLFDEIEMPLVPILYRMEKEGIEIDTDFLAKFSKELSKRLEKLTKDIQKEAGQEFNVNSPLQLTEILFEKLELPTKGIKRTKSGYSTAASELEKLRDVHKIIPMVEEYRELAKLASTYVDALPKLVAKDGRVHSSFNQVVTTTGRLSSSDPNLQNIPIRTELGREIRKAFVAGKDKVLLSADYSQIDLRVVTIITKDKAFMKAFNDGADIHTRTASEVWNIPEDKVTKSQRRSAKAINFGIIYGMGPRALAASTDLTFSEAQVFIEDYLNAHPALQKYLEETKESAHELGYVETMFGRRRYLPELDSGVHMLVAAAERMAINMPVQGAASDIMKIAMIKVFKWLQDKDDIKMLLQVHDELVFEAAKDKVESYGKKIKSIMEEAVDLGVPLVVDVEAGKNWGEMK